MTVSIAVASGKGGVTKSTLIRALGVSYALADWKVLGADMDIGQGTLIKWNKRRAEANIGPLFHAQSFGAVPLITREIQSDKWDIVLIDCPAFASASTIHVAELADFVIIPTRYSLDDMQSTAETANALINAGIPAKKIAVVFSGVAESEAEHAAAINYFGEAPYFLIEGYIPQKTSYSKAQDVGRAVIECSHPGLRSKADKVIQNIISRFEEVIEE
ncbi:ParA family protein [Pantoea sp. YU22]|uniref:ParA family protein n=1 Tax=Pantoea sp. YU22 TaxID=2497684 RepID=UPI000F8892E0|nr:ParA family protein [Pantoea sp. YU22]RTY53673.1 ParA family protein [Pantoea sp. YU22]